MGGAKVMADGGPGRVGWPTQARFWLEWGCPDLPNSVIPTGTDHRESGDLRSGGTLCLTLASDEWRSSQNGRQETRTSGRKTPSRSRTAPTQAKNGLEWATREGFLLKSRAVHSTPDNSRMASEADSQSLTPIGEYKRGRCTEFIDSRMVGQPEAIEKRAWARSMCNLPEADFWPAPRRSFREFAAVTSLPNKH